MTLKVDYTLIHVVKDRQYILFSVDIMKGCKIVASRSKVRKTSYINSNTYILKYDFCLQIEANAPYFCHAGTHPAMITSWAH